MSVPSSAGSEAEGRPSAGYYPDPSIPGYVRYWDGGGWLPGTSRPAPSDGEPLAPPRATARASAPSIGFVPPPSPHLPTGEPSPLEESGPIYLDETSGLPLTPSSPGLSAQPLHPGDPENPWQADAAQQRGLMETGRVPRWVSWGAPEQDESPAAQLLHLPTSDVRPRTGDPLTPAGAGPAPSPAQAPYPSPGPSPYSAPSATASLGPAPTVAQAPAPVIAQPSAPADTQAPTVPHPFAAPASAPAVPYPSAAPTSAPASAFAQRSAPADTQASAVPYPSAAPTSAPAPAQGPASAPVQAQASYSAQAQAPSPERGATALPRRPVPAAPTAPELSQPHPAGTRPAAQGHASAGRSGPPFVGASAPGDGARPMSPAMAAFAPPTTAPAASPAPAAPASTPASALASDPAPAEVPAPRRIRAVGGRQAGPRPALLGRRLGARLLDLAIVAGAVTPIAVPLVNTVTLHLQQKIDIARTLDGDSTVWLVDPTVLRSAGLLVLAVLTVGLVYEALPTALWGRTLGKALFGLRVLDLRSKRKPGLGRALARWLSYQLLLLLAVGVFDLMWCMVDRPWRQCWHDKAGGTFVTSGAAAAAAAAAKEA